MTDARPRTRAEATATRRDERQAAGVSRRWPLISGSVAVVLVAALGAIIALREGNLPLSLDSEWMAEIMENRNSVWEVPALLMNNIGGGIVGAIVVPLVVLGFLCLARRFWGALFFAIATIASAAIVQLLKSTFGRPRPLDMLVTSDLGSFPSGHTANAATMTLVLALIFPRVWVWAAGIAYTVLMLLSRTYLGAHWLSDTVGGLVLGAAVAVIAWAPFAHRLYLEQSSLRERRRTKRRETTAGRLANEDTAA